MNSLEKILEQDIDNGFMAMCDYMKMALYQHNATIFEQIDFENDEAFLQPLLFTYLTTQQPENYMTLEQILCSYFIETEWKIDVKSDEYGIVFIPRIGYFHTKKPKHTLLLSRNNGNYSIENTYFDFEPSLTVAGGNIEVYRYVLPILYPFFSKYDNSNELANPSEIEFEMAVETHIKHIETAFELIKSQTPELYAEIVKTNKSLCVFTNPDVFCFVNISVNGCVFLSTIPSNETVFFIEELIHQCTHNAFNIILFDKNKYFKIDAETVMLGDLIDNEHEIRTVYSTFHGLCTVTKRYTAFYEFYKNSVFDNKQKHEFLGRLADMKKRFRTGLELLNLEEVYTQEGIRLYQLLDNTTTKIIEKLSSFENQYHFDLSNQPLEFSYEYFLQLNPLSDFEPRHMDLVVS